jgi:hypothetical protein
MKSLDFDIFFSLVAFVVFTAIMFGALAYVETLRAECRKTAIEKNMAAAEIQSVCGR